MNNNKFSDSGDEWIRKQGPSTVDTHVLAIATTLSSLLHCICSADGNLDLDIRPHRNGILLGGRHLGGRRLLTPELQYIGSDQPGVVER